MLALILTSLYAENFRSFTQESFTFADQTVIRAMNAQGKSTIAEAIVWCLYGTDIRGKAKMDGELLQTGATSMRVVTQWEQENGSTVTVERVKPEKGSTKVLVDGQKAAPGQLEGLFFSYVNEFLSVFIPGYFSSLEPKEAKAILARYGEVSVEEVVGQLLPHEQEVLAGIQFGMGYDSVEVYRKKVADQLKSEEAEKLRLEGEVRAAEEALQAGKPKAPQSLVTAEYLQKVNDYKQKLMNVSVFQDIERQLQTAIQQRDQLRSTYKTVKATLFALEENCPVCGQELDVKGRQRVNLKVHAHNVPIQNHLKELQKQGDQWNKTLQELKTKQKEYGPGPSDEQIGRWQTYISKIETQMLKERDEQTRYQTQLEAYTNASKNLEERRQFLAQQDKIVTSLKAQLEAIKAFRFRYVKLQQSKLDQLFDRVKIILSKVNEDGELKDAFQITWNGKPYKTLSTSEKVRCDLEIGRAIAGMSKSEPVPVFVDNAEGVQKLFQERLERQTIAAYVFESELTVQERNEAKNDIEGQLQQFRSLISGSSVPMRKGA